jgi:hypothetical protein
MKTKSALPGNRFAQHSAHARVYISMEHHWTAKNHRDPLQACPGRTLLELFAKRARERGDFDWNLAFHPYPSNLRDPRTWLDKVSFNDNSPKVTFKNLEVLTKKLATPEMLYAGKPRRLSFTEQGFDFRIAPKDSPNRPRPTPMRGKRSCASAIPSTPSTTIVTSTTPLKTAYGSDSGATSPARSPNPTRSARSGTYSKPSTPPNGKPPPNLTSRPAA